MNMRPEKDAPLADVLGSALKLHPYLSDKQIAPVAGVADSTVGTYRRKLGVPTVATITRELRERPWRKVHDRLLSMTDEEAAAELECSPYTVRTYRVLYIAASGAPAVEVDAREWDAAMVQLYTVHEQIAELQESHRRDRMRVERARDHQRRRADVLEAMLRELREGPSAQVKPEKTSAGGETHFAPCRLDVSDVIETAGDAPCGDRRRVEPWRIEGGALTVYNELGLGVSVKVDDALRAALSNFQKVEP